MICLLNQKLKWFGMNIKLYLALKEIFIVARKLFCHKLKMSLMRKIQEKIEKVVNEFILFKKKILHLIF